MEHRNISLFRGYSDTESVETSLEEVVNLKSATIIQYTIKGRFMSR